MSPALWILAQVVAAPIQAATDDRPVRLWLGPSPVAQGAAIPVYVAAVRDGYLLVLRVATDGRVTVVFPAEPQSNGFVARGAYNLRAPGGQPALVVNERSGTGLVLAALSATPFRFSEFTRAGRFDTGLLAASYPGADGPGTLTDIAQRMLGDGWFNSDFALYTVRSAATAAALARRQARADAAELAERQSVAQGQNGEGIPIPIVVYQTVSPQPVLEQTVVERSVVEPVLIIASVCEPGAGGCHPSGFHRRRHDRREPTVKTSGVCQIGIDCPPGVGAPAKALALGMSPVRRSQPVSPPAPLQPAIPVPAPAQVERIAARAKPVTYVMMSAPAAVTQPARRTPSGTTKATQARTVTLPRVGTAGATGGSRTMTSRQAGTALRAARILPVH